ncbi:hypothetical protein N658DRAFT_507990 [Parathielavia hyrcaniae]|uniref:Clr5 domain-containing protein n=1 Tax=Parathielavia hyrcaniae TaxID=113614 RepID=A0AAN6T065_9PEZI|nr:hypothetical protein N658DRAFT_507990 [Parathielavia hyrcaniae]
MNNFIEGSRKCSPRIPDEKWMEVQPILIALYTVNTLPEVMAIMEHDHQFFATRRQYVHRFQAWKIKKYKNKEASPESATEGPVLKERPAEAFPPLTQAPLATRIPPVHTFTDPPVSSIHAALVREQSDWTSQLVSAVDKTRCLRLADMLFALGDFHHCFNINATLWDHQHPQDYHITCVRTAQSLAQAGLVRPNVESDVSYSQENDETWTATLSEFLWAYTFDWDRDVGHRLVQIGKIVSKIVDDPYGQDFLKPLAPRGPCLDVLAYIFFRAGLVRYNRQCQDDSVDIPRVLQQFLSQQPAFQQGPDLEFDPLLHLDSLTSCLSWCAETLSATADISPEMIPGADGNPVAQAYALLCTLWSLSLSPQAEASGTGPDFSPLTWANTSKRQLGIAPTELLGAVVCMITAAAAQHNNRDIRVPQTLRQRALAGAHALRGLDSNELIYRFLGQVWAANESLAFRADGPPHGSRHDVEMVEAARGFVAESLGICLPPLGQGAVVYPLVLAGFDTVG